MSDLIGRDLGRYHILEQLGEGGMATVYKAYDTRLERDVAVKVIRTDQFGAAVLERMMKRFDREAKALARLTHPNIVNVIDYGEHEGTPFLVMPYLPGGTLKQRLGKPMPWQEVARLLAPIAQALDYAHSQGVIHRDIKPSNILLTGSGQPMLTDFGIAKILEDGDAMTLTGTGIGLGTPEYMAPEQWTGQTSPQSDIYSLGVVFYEMVAGRKPYVADTPAAVLLKQANEPLPRPGQFAPGLPDVVEKALLKALAKKPEDRYRSMGAFARALEGLAQGVLPAGERRPAREAAPQPALKTKKEQPAAKQTLRGDKKSLRRTAWIVGGSLFLVAAAIFAGVAIRESLTGNKNVNVPGPVAISNTITPTILSMTISVPPSPTDLPTPIPTPVGGGSIIYSANYSSTSSINADGKNKKVLFSNYGVLSHKQDRVLTWNEIIDKSGNKVAIPVSLGIYNGVWSPDDNQIFFTSNQYRSSQSDIYIVNSDGTNLRRLSCLDTYGQSVGADYSAVGWLPDGQQILATMRVYSNYTLTSTTLFLFNQDCTGVHSLNYSPAPGNQTIALSPDGNTVAWLDNYGLYLMNINQPDRTLVTDTLPICNWCTNTLAWSPDSKSILFSQNIHDYSSSETRSIESGIFLMHPGSEAKQQLSTFGFNAMWSPDGKWIVFQSSKNGNKDEIYVMNADGSNIIQITNEKYDYITQMEWRPATVSP